MTHLPEKLILLLQTDDQAQLLQALLLDAKDASYTRKTSPIERLKKITPASLQQDLFSFLEKEGIDLHNEKAVSDMLQTIMTQIPKLPTLTITIAVQPNFEIQTFLFKLVQQIHQVPTLLKIIYNPDILGGAVLQYEGHYKDYSLEKRFL